MPQLPYFFQPSLPDSGLLRLDEATARHIGSVLRMQPGEKILLTDGRGKSATAALSEVGKKSVSAAVEAVEQIPALQPGLHLAISFTKNASRNEWVLEKATELGVRSIVVLQTQRSEREQFKAERWNNILVSAMIQSRQSYLPELIGPLKPEDCLKRFAGVSCKLIAHCTELPKQPLAQFAGSANETLIMIGPEGDFTGAEVTLALESGASGVSLGKTRLRTETAAIAACAFLQLNNED